MILTPDIERVLAEHELLEPVEETDVDRCSCGNEFEYASYLRHRAHLAEQIAALLADREKAARAEGGREALLGAADEMDRRDHAEAARIIRNRAAQKAHEAKVGEAW